MTDVFNIAQAATEVDTGDTAWMIVATALVLLMTPGLGLFYAGLVRGKNTLNTYMMCIAAIAVATVTWAAVGYSLAFDGTGDLVGGLNHAFLNDVTFEPRDGTTIPHLIFFAFQATFCIITMALISGAVVERMRFSAFIVFAALWTVLVYSVLAHWGFGGGWLFEGGTFDFAGGIAVEMASGFSALAAAIVVGARKDWGRQALLPHNSVYVLLGASLLWFGWFGFNGGSGFNTGQNSVLAFTNTLLCPAASLLAWFLMDAIRGRRVTAVGAATAIIVGCVLITPAGGFIAPGWAMLLGAAGALPCYAVIVFRSTRVDETLDVLAAHGVAGFVGILFIGFFAQENWNALGDGLLYGDAEQLKWQVYAALATPVYAFVMTAVLLKVISFVMPLRVTEKDESQGLDVTQHNEEAYATGEGAILVLPQDGESAGRMVKDPGLA
jgi:Amt family ammonium transporter